MPQILESEAFALAQGIDAMTPENQARAADVLRRYREQQREYGLPDFPTAEQQRREGEDRYFSLFDDLKNVDAASPSFSTGLRLSANPDADRARVVNTAFLARQYGKTAEEVSRAFPFFRDDFAAKSGAEPGLEDAAFYQHAAKIAKGQKATRDVQERSLNEGFRAAVEGMGSLEKLAEVRALAAGNTDNEIDAKAFLSAYEQTQAIMSKHAGFIREFSDAIASDMDGGQVDLGPLNERLLDLPGTERRLVLAALRMQAEKGGEKVKEAKGGENQGSQAAKSFAEILTLGQYREGKFFQQTGEAAARIASNAAFTAADIERKIESVSENNIKQGLFDGSQGVRFSGTEIKTPEQARKYVREAISYSMATEASASGAGPAGAGGFAMADDRNIVTLDADAQKLIRDAKDRELKRLRVSNEIRSIGETADPIPNVFASTIGTSGAALGLMAATRGFAAPMLLNAYSNIEYNDLSLKYPQMTSADKKLVAGVSAAVQTALDYVGVKALDKLPGIKSLVSQPFTRQLATRALARGGVSFASENVVEAAQDIATPAIIEALRVDAPGFDAAAEARDFWKGRADVAIGLLPLTLVGIGAASVNEYRGAKELLTWNDQLGAAGVVETDRVAIIEAAQAGNTSQAQTILRESWGRRSPEVAAEYQDAMSQRQNDLASATAELERLGAMPTLARDADGWTVTSDGKTAKFATWEEARDVATAAMNDMERAQAELVASLADSFLGSTPGFLKGERVEFRPKSETLTDRVNAGAMTPEQAMEAAVAGGVIKGATMAEARAIAGEVFGGQDASARAMQFRQDVERIAVLGRNTVQDGQSRSVVNAAGNERAFLTAVEEITEGRWKAGLERRAFTKEMGVRWVQLAESATGEAFLEGSTWDEIAASSETAPRALTEAISRVVVADVLGRMREGKRIGPGAVSRGLNLNDREQSALTAILDAFRKLFRALLETASKLAKARQEGKLGGEYDALFDALTGGSSQLEHDAGAAKEADAIAAEAVDTSGYSPENPGPNGETFSMSRAVPADASKVVQMPDGAQLVGPTTFSIRAYHGTPHKVDKFTTAKIGTGEGAQAYGWGLYFAENEGVAAEYQKRLGATAWKLIAEYPSVSAEAAYKAKGTLGYKGNKLDAKREIQSELRDGIITQEVADEAIYLIDTAEGGGGNLYTVELLPDGDQFLDWDKPLSDQSEKVKAAMREYIAKNRPAYSWDRAQDLEGQKLYIFGLPSGNREATSKAFAESGIPGIRYLDGGSRPANVMDARLLQVFEQNNYDVEKTVAQMMRSVYNTPKKKEAIARNYREQLEKGKPTRNYVIFDENLVRILEENGKPVEGETFSLRPGDFAARMEAKFSLFQAKPELRLAIAQVAKERALRLGAEWIAKGDVIRTAKDIGKEQAFREADGFDRRMTAYLDGLFESARQTLEFEPSALEGDPLVAAMLDEGKLMSRSTAVKNGVKNLDEYDGVPWLPPAWYSKGAGITPGKMAKALHDGPQDQGGPLRGDSAQELWDSLAEVIASTRKDKAAHREAVQAYKDAQKVAKAEAKAEAEAWANQARETAGSPKAQRDMLKAALRTLDGILAAAPPEVRARVGGYVKLAGLATDEAMLAEIERRIDKMNRELEKYLKKEAVREIEKLFKKARPDMEAGKKGKGKDADMHALFAAAEAAADMDALAVAGRLADLDARIASGELTPEQEVLAVTERGLVELVGDLKNADSGRAFSALDSLRDIYQGAWLKWKLAEIERKERRAGMRQDFIVATGKAGLKPERDAADNEAKEAVGRLKGSWLSLSSLHQVLSYVFGLKSSRVDALVDAEREASSKYEDESQKLGDEVEALFSEMGGGSVLEGERLRYRLAQRTIKTDKGELSQLEAIQALLMWRQEDGKRHMEGTRNENNEVTSKWSYDQAWIDEIEAALTPEARRVMAFISERYAAEWATLNPLYRARYGVNMPHHDAYAPITVTPAQTKAGEVVDPVTGSAVSGGSILTPGSLRTRSRNAIAEPEFRDALQTLILHNRQIAYWKAYYDLAVEMNAVLGNREVLNAVHASGGKNASSALRQWVDAIAQGGFRDASNQLAFNRGIANMAQNAATMALLGKAGTLAIQSTQLAASALLIPTGSFVLRFGKLLAGRLGWRDAIKSDFIQRRYKAAPAIVRQALDNLSGAQNPSAAKYYATQLGKLLSGADAFFTAGSYAILLDYHRGQGRAAGMTGAELDAYAHREAERGVEQVAQPTRMATRSLWEVTAMHPALKSVFAYSSEARQKIAYLGWSLLNAKKDPQAAGRTVMVSLLMAAAGVVIRNAWKDMKGDDDEEKWSLPRISGAMLYGMVSGIPLIGDMFGESGQFSAVKYAAFSAQDIAEGDGDLKDWWNVFQAAGLFSSDIAAIVALANAGVDAAKVIEATQTGQ